MMKPALAHFRRPAAAALLFLALLATLFSAYAFLPLAAPHRYASPDESSNRFFAALFAKEGKLWHFDSLNLYADGRVRPRSTRYVDDFVVPGGFLGLPVVYGGLAKSFGLGILPYLTPAFAVLGVIAWANLLSKLFGWRASVAGAVLLAFHPAWWYVTARTLQPNVLFASLALIAAWVLVVTPIRAALADREGLRLLKGADAPLAGIAFGLALAVRPSEAYWIAPAAVAAVIALRGKVPWIRLAVFLAFVLLAIAPFLFLNKTVYGGWFSTGYGDAPTGIPTAAMPQGGGARLLGPLRPVLFPLGFAPRVALANAWTYLAAFFPAWTFAVAAAFAWLFSARKRLGGVRALSPAVRAFAAFSVVGAVWLIFFYGSWSVQDNPDPGAVTIGSSYLRYWLPVFMASVVPVAWAVRDFSGCALRAKVGRPFLLLMAVAYVAYGAFAAFMSPQEGLLALRRTLFAEDAVARAVVAKTEDKALVVVDRADKFLWPERRVMQPLRDEGTYAALAKVAATTPAYYFGITFPEGDLRWLNETKLPPLGLGIEPVEEFGEETLYRFTVIEKAKP